MSSKDGLHSRFHKQAPVTRSYNDGDAPHRGALLVDSHDPSLNDSLDRPLLAGDGGGGSSGSEPCSPTETRFLRGSSSSGTSSLVARREPSRWDSARFAAMSVACSVLDLLPASVSLKMTDEPTSTERQQVHALRDAVVHPFDKTIPAHRELLVELWDVCHRGKQLFALTADAPPALPEDLKSERWKDFGFQGVDPSTDFRGAGVFSLRNLMYLSATYPQLFGKLVRAEYPFAVAGINVTMLLMTQLGLTAVGQTCLATVQNSSASVFSFNLARVKFCKLVAVGGAAATARDAELVFSEVYCVSLALLHDRWLQSNRNIMEFNFHLKWLAKQMETLLKCSPDLSAILASVKVD